MKICRLLRGCAVLTSIVCFALPRAEAFTITVNPSPFDQLDVTINAAGAWVKFFDGPFIWRQDTLDQQAIVTPSGFRVGGYINGDGIYDGFFSVVRPPQFGQGRFDYAYATVSPISGSWRNAPDSMPYLGITGGSKQLPQDWPGPAPVMTRIDNLTLRITWDVSADALAVPDAGSTLLMLAGAVIGLYFHRRREIAKPRALSGV